MTDGLALAAQAIASLMPARRELIYDILKNDIQADVSDWANYKKGLSAPAANPKYCYEWCFTQAERHVVLNLWHANLKTRGGDVVCELNMRAYANEIARAKDEPWRDKKPKPVWEKRARNMDLSIQLALRKKLPVRVIVCEGNMRDLAAGDEKASEVKRRMIDPVAWAIDSYDLNTGQTILRRGLNSVPPAEVDPHPADADSPEATKIDQAESSNQQAQIPESPKVGAPEPAYVDQFDTELRGEPERRDTSGSVFVRRPDVRVAALHRAGGNCQLCGQPGFLTLSGKIYLETHHVRPLSEGGPDVLANVVALCATDHRRAHFDIDNLHLRSRLLQIAAKLLR